MKFLTKALIVALGLIPGACAPLFSDMQGARLVGKRNFEITPGFSSVGITQEGHKQRVASYLGFSAAYGLSDKVDLRLRFEHSWLKRSLSGEYGRIEHNLIAIGPKINLARDRAALFLPLGIGPGDIVQFQPTLLFTVPIVRGKVELNPSLKHLATICDVCWEPLVAVNAGLAISSDVTKWAIRPEYGVLYNLRSPGRFSNFSIGVSVNLSAF